MLRCVAAIFAAALLMPLAQAQVHRNFPPTTLRGELVVVAAPEATLNGQPARLAPGARIRGETNMLETPAVLSGRKLIVHYTREPATGLLMDVWVLNAAELANRVWPTSEREARTWYFDPAGQAWTKK